MRTSFNRMPPAQQCCEVCRAASVLQRAVDALNTFLALGGVPDREDPRMEAVKQATAVWEFTKDRRHTGLYHAPVVVG